jgi:hypothetical protein
VSQERCVLLSILVGRDRNFGSIIMKLKLIADYSQCLRPTTTISSTTTTMTTTTPGSTATGLGLHNLAKAAGKKYFGSATDNPELSDSPYVAQLSNVADFGQITPVSSNIRSGAT